MNFPSFIYLFFFSLSKFSALFIYLFLSADHALREKPALDDYLDVYQGLCSVKKVFFFVVISLCKMSNNTSCSCQFLSF